MKKTMTDIYVPSVSTRGFSLVELSIVLVILGLLTGGILAGQSLIRAAELRGVSTEAGRYVAAISTFKDKYFATPGDMNNATAFGWTANGDGDGNIESTVNAASTANPGNSNEVSSFWAHLASAGLVEGTYTYAINTTSLAAGTHTPRSKVSGAGWQVNALGNIAASSLIFYEGNYGNVIMLGGAAAYANAANPPAAAMTGVLKSEEAWNIDTKMDDGRPALGSFRTAESQGNATAGSGCGNLAAHATNSMAASTYDLTNASATACSVVLRTGY